MPVKTEHYLLEAFLDGDAYLAVADKRRFSTIDSQLYRVAEIIGDGRIDGWEITEEIFPNITISAGSGLIDKYYVNTFDDQIVELSANGIFYIYLQRRVGTIGSIGPRSDVASISYTDLGPPATPSEFSVDAPEPFVVTIEWDANTEVDLDHYELERRVEPNDFTIIANNINPASTSYEDITVDEDVTYIYNLYAVDQSGNRSTIPATGTVTTPLDTALPPNPFEIQTPFSENAINVLWKRPPQLAFSKISHYLLSWVELNTDNTEKPETRQTRIINKNLYYDRIDDLINGQRYKVTLQTVDTKDRISEGYVRNVTPQPTPAPRDPEGIAFEMSDSPGGVEVSLSWDSGDTPYDPADSYRYRIYVTVDGQSESLGIDVPIGESEETVSLYTFDLVGYFPIPEDSLVTFRLTSLDTNGIESFGNFIRFETALFTPPLRIRNLDSSFNTDTGNIVITWDNQNDTDDIRIQILKDALDDEYINDVEIVNEFIGAVERYVLTDVELDNRYTIRVTPLNTDRIEGPTSTTVELTLISGGLPLPEPPIRLDAQSNDRQIRLTWEDSPTDYATTYSLYRKSGEITFEFEDWELLDTMPSTINSFTDYGLENDETYSYYLTVSDVYGRESLHLEDDAINLNFVEATPQSESILTQPDNVQAVLDGNNRVLLTWDSLLEEFDSFVIYRSINNLHSWTEIGTVPKDTLQFNDITLPLIDGTVFYYTVGKTFNDSDIIVQSTSVAPENSLFLAKVSTDSNSVSEIDVTLRRDIQDLIDPLAEYTSRFLLPHKHRELEPFDPDRIDLNPQIIVTDWSTVDGRIWTTQEEDINGTSYILKVNNRFPRVFFTVDAVGRRIIFSEPIADVDPDTGQIFGEPPVIELRILGAEEVQGTLEAFRFDNLHARQVAFGTLNKDQLPDLNHEGRIREELIPKRYLLERFNNHTFIVPQDNTDSGKTFGDGTTFYSVIDADGAIEEIADFDLQDDGETVVFQKPSFSTDTILNLKQNSESSEITSGNNVSNEYNFGTLWASFGGSGGTLRTINESTAAETNIGGSWTGTPVTSTFDSDAKKFYVADSNGNLYTVDLGSGDDSLVSTIDVTTNLRAIEYNPDDGIMYGIYLDGSTPTLISIVVETGATTDIGTLSGPTSGNLTSLAYDSENSVMYVAEDTLGTGAASGHLMTVDLSDASTTDVGDFNFGANRQMLEIAFTNGSLYGYAVLVTLAELYSINTSTGEATSISSLSGTIGSLSGSPENDFYFASSSGVPGSDKIRMGSFPGFTTDTYLRYELQVPRGSTVSDCSISFTADADDAGTGDNVKLEISILDPEGLSDSVDLQFNTITAVSTLGSVIWSPPTWSTGENSGDTTVDVTNLVKRFVDRDSYFPGQHIIFKIATKDTTDVNHYRVAESVGSPPPSLDVNFTRDLAEVNSNPGGFQSNKAYRLQFEFNDDDPTRWVKISTKDTPIKGNPIIDLEKRLRFRIKLSGASVYVGFGIREINPANPVVGEDGGTNGPIEWVNVSEIITDDFNNEAPKGATLIEATGEWQEIDIDLQKAPTISYQNGNGLLSKGYGVLEHIAFTINPEDSTPEGPFDIFIDEIQQISDLLVAGTSQGILLSRDFGSTWEVSRLTETPVHKFYRSPNNGFLWAITADQVLLSTDPAFWFVTQGTTGIHYIRDITDDSNGDMFISTDKGVYKLEIALIRNFARFKQTQPVNAFTTDCYAIYHRPVSSGLDEIWVSTEIGIFKTTDAGRTWQDTGMETAGLPAYQIINIGTNNSPNLIGCTRKHIVRKQGNANNFETIANFEEQFNIFDIWKIEYFSQRLYVSTGDGIYMNSMDDLNMPSPLTSLFEKVFEKLNKPNFNTIAFGLDTVDLGDFGQRLFIGVENSLYSSNELNQIALKAEFRNKELPSFFINDVQTDIGFIYNAFNNVVCFRDPRPVTEIISSAFLPRRTFIAKNGGWVQTNPDAEVFVYRNETPTWLDWALDETSILAEMQSLEGKLNSLPALNTFNSLFPESQEFLNATLADIQNIREGGESNEEGEPTTLINDDTIIKFFEDYTRFLSLVTEDVRVSNDLNLPSITLSGIRRVDRPANSRAATLEAQEDFESLDTTNITIDVTTGTVDFLNAFANSTTLEDRQRYTFNKFERLRATIFNSNVKNTGEFTHTELEDKMEDINSGLSSGLARAVHANLIKTGIFAESQNPFMFTRYNASNVQSKFYAAHTNDWYDILNSTVDYRSIVGTGNVTESRFVNKMVLFTDDPYFNNKIWVATDRDIIQYDVDTSGSLTIDNVLRPGNFNDPVHVWDIFLLSETEVYVVVSEGVDGKAYLFKTVNFGTTWEEIDTINLPNQFFTITVINGNLVVGTSEGVFYSDNDFGAWFPSGVVPSDQIGNESPSLDAFRQRIRQIENTTFLITEQDRWLFTSGGGLEFFSLGRVSNNNMTVINKILRFKNITWIGTDKGLYNDGNSILSDSVQLGLETDLEDSANDSAQISINDITAGENAVYAAGGNGKLYRFLDTGNGNEWKRYDVSDLGPLHKILLYENESKHLMIVSSYNKIRILDVTPDTGVFG